MSAARCIKLALLLSLIPLALRATSLLLGGGHGVPATAAASSHHRHYWAAWQGRRSRATAAATVAVVSAEPAVRGRPSYRRARPRSAAALAAPDGGTRQLRQVAAAAAGDWFEDDKRLAPTGSNPLHNLRR